MTPPAQRRDYGTGSIYQRADGRWIAAIQAGWTPTGARRRVTVSAACPCTGPCKGEGKCQGWRDTRRKLDRKKAELETTGAPTAGTTRTATVKTWADVWVPMHTAKVRASTSTTDTGALRKWIIPTIGHRRLDALTPGDVRAVHLAVTGAGLTTTTARHAHSVLVKMLKAAILEGHQVPQRVLLVEAPPVATNDRDAIPLPDALKILKAALERPDAARWVAALLQGMRQGECLGLTWDAIDFDNGVIDVTWQLDSLPYADKAKGTFRIKPGMKARHLEGSWFLTEVKTSKGNRVIPMVPWMAAALTQWRDIAPPSRHGLVWPRPDGRPRNERDDRAQWVALQRAAGVQHRNGRPFTLHESRHSSATLLLQAGVDPEVIKAILGHSSIVTSMGYVHIDHQLKRDAMSAVAARLGLDLPAIEPPALSSERRDDVE